MRAPRTADRPAAASAVGPVGRLVRGATAAVPSTLLLGAVAAVVLVTTPAGETLRTSTSRVDQPYLEVAALPVGEEGRLGTDCVRGYTRVLFSVRNAGPDEVDVPWTVEAVRIGRRGRLLDAPTLERRYGTVAVEPGATVPVTSSLPVQTRRDIALLVELPGEDLGLRLTCRASA